MKKTIVMFGIISMLAAGAASAGEYQAVSTTGERPYNGITWFDLGPASTSQNLVLEQSTVKSFNGITAFALGQTPTRRARTLAESAKFAAVSNGVTVF